MLLIYLFELQATLKLPPEQVQCQSRVVQFEKATFMMLPLAGCLLKYMQPSR